MRDTLGLPDGTAIEASLFDAANACAMIGAADVGLTGLEMPEALEARPDVLARLDEIRVVASLAMGVGRDAEEARRKRHVPFIAILSPAAAFTATSGVAYEAGAMDFTARIISSGQPHGASGDAEGPSLVGEGRGAQFERDRREAEVRIDPDDRCPVPEEEDRLGAGIDDACVGGGDHAIEAVEAVGACPIAFGGGDDTSEGGGLDGSEPVRFKRRLHALAELGESKSDGVLAHHRAPQVSVSR